MKSSSGAHYIALDHVRALAAFMVVAWHFTHGRSGVPVPFEYVPSVVPLAVLDEGHTGVALFMTLSGYLFAKLLDGKAINYRAFIWNRGLRLLPLLVTVIALVGVSYVIAGDVTTYLFSIAQGLILPTLPNGGWSITVEFHFYLILPLFLWMLRKSKLLPISIVMFALMTRLLIYRQGGDIVSLAYGTIVGRIDQFARGMLAHQFRGAIRGRHAIAIGTIGAFLVFYWYFDGLGGLRGSEVDPVLGSLWIFMPTIEALAYAIAIAWYDNSFAQQGGGVSRFIARIGEYSYSIYLLHFFIVFRAAKLVNDHVVDISNFYVACLCSVVFIVLMMVPGYLSFRFIEAPFLMRRKRYVR